MVASPGSLPLTLHLYSCWWRISVVFLHIKLSCHICRSLRSLAALLNNGFPFVFLRVPERQSDGWRGRGRKTGGARGRGGDMKTWFLSTWFISIIKLICCGSKIGDKRRIWSKCLKGLLPCRLALNKVIIYKPFYHIKPHNLNLLFTIFNFAHLVMMLVPGIAELLLFT